jgi:3D (Asp-Asp-Asp) domain-containing protein
VKTSPLFSACPETSVQRIAHFSMLAGCAVLCLGLSTTAAVRVSALTSSSEVLPKITYVQASAAAPLAPAPVSHAPVAHAPVALIAARSPETNQSDELLKPIAQKPVEMGSAVSHRSLSTTRTIRLQVTAYCPCKICCGAQAHGVTASGHRINYAGGKFVAADTDLLPFGTMLSIPGYHNGKPVEVIDRGGDIKGRHIDVFFPTHKQAKEWGVRYVNVAVTDSDE